MIFLENKLDNDYPDKGYVVITPMSIDENAPQLLNKLLKKIDLEKYPQLRTHIVNYFHQRRV